MFSATPPSEDIGRSALPRLGLADREVIGARVTSALAKINYRSAGTIEFLYEDEEFYFIEMNTRLQVEHPISEMICGVDLVREQLRIATGAPLSLTQEKITYTGHAIECRINAKTLEPLSRIQVKLTSITRQAVLACASIQRLFRLYGAAVLRQSSLKAHRSRRQP